jgi:DNA-binding IscR family transcriptional regulator
MLNMALYLYEICLVQKYIGEYVTILSLAERLNISKIYLIYLEQIFFLLKHDDLVSSIH